MNQLTKRLCGACCVFFVEEGYNLQSLSDSRNAWQIYSLLLAFTMEVQRLISRVVTGNGGTQERSGEKNSSVEKGAVLAKAAVSLSQDEHSQNGANSFLDCAEDGTDVWEIDLKQLDNGAEVASGPFGDLYGGTCCGQEVAIKILKPGSANAAIVKRLCPRNLYDEILHIMVRDRCCYISMSTSVLVRLIMVLEGTGHSNPEGI